MPEVSDSTIKERAAEGRTGNWGEVVTRQPYRKVRLDHLLSKEKKQVRKLVILFSYREIIENTKEIERFQWAYSSAGQSARLISVRSVVRVHLSPLKTKYLLTQFLLSWGRSSVGRAPALQAGGQEFESLRLHCERKFTVNNLNFFKKVLTKQNKFDILQQLSKTADK